MFSDASSASSIGGRRRVLPRIVAGLFVLAIVGGAVYWLARPERVTATALFEVRIADTSLIGNDFESASEWNYEIVKKTQVAKLKSKYLLTSALRDPSIAASPVFASADNAEEWLQSHLEIGYPENGELLAISLSGPKAQADDLCQVVDAIAEAYDREVLAQEKSRRLAIRDLLERSLQNLNAEIKRKYEDFLDLQKSLGKAEGEMGFEQQLGIKRLDRLDAELAELERAQLKLESDEVSNESKFIAKRTEQLHKRKDQLSRELKMMAEKSTVLITYESELKQRQKVADELLDRLEKVDIDLNVPPRIRKVQDATIDPPKIASW